MPKPMPYDEAVAEVICNRIIEGQSLREICRDEGMPSKSVVYRWLDSEPKFRDSYARARESQMEVWADELKEIADDSRNDYMDRLSKDGTIDRVLDPENVQRSRLRIDTMKWLMSKLAPRKYSDKIDINLSGKVEIESLSDNELQSRMMQRLATLGIEHAAPLLIGQSSTAASEPEPELEPQDVTPNVTP